MAILQVNDHPTLGINDQLVIHFRDFESKGRLFVRSRTANAVVTVQSGKDIDSGSLGDTATLTTFPCDSLEQTTYSTLKRLQ